MDKNQKEKRIKKKARKISQTVTIFGAGFVVKPMVDYLAKNGFNIIIADKILSKAKDLAAPHPNATAYQFLVDDEKTMEEFIRKSDIVVSLLPADKHVSVALGCIKHKTNMVSTSYISPEMKELNDAARKAGIIILNEIGVDPGIDHMSAMKIFHDVEKNGGKITSFMSYCGGLPALEANTNPMGYKFSWSPKGVLRAARNDARYLLDGNIVKIEGKNLFQDYQIVEVDGCSTFEAYPNRDSLGYIEKYDLKHVSTMYRGTFRNISHCETWLILSKMGFFTENTVYKKLDGTIREFILTKLLGLTPNDDIKKTIMDRFDLNASSVILRKFKWLGFFDNTAIPISSGAPIDVLTEIMLQKMPFKEGERDMLVLHHRFTAEYPDKTQIITSTMIDHGIASGDSSMSRTVSLPAAIGVRLILENKILSKGVSMPILPEIYLPVLSELDNLGIRLEERYF